MGSLTLRAGRSGVGPPRARGRAEQCGRSRKRPEVAGGGVSVRFGILWPSFFLVRSKRLCLSIPVAARTERARMLRQGVRPELGEGDDLCPSSPSVRDSESGTSRRCPLTLSSPERTHLARLKFRPANGSARFGPRSHRAVHLPLRRWRLLLRFSVWPTSHRRKCGRLPTLGDQTAVGPGRQGRLQCGFALGVGVAAAWGLLCVPVVPGLLSVAVERRSWGAASPPCPLPALRRPLILSRRRL